MSDATVCDTPFASQLEDIQIYVSEFKNSNNASIKRFNNNLKNLANASIYSKSNQTNTNKFNNKYHNSIYSYKNNNSRKDNSFNFNGDHNGYFNLKQKRNYYNNGNDYNSGIDNSYKSYNYTTFNSNNFNRKQRNFNNNNYNGNTYNQNSNFTNHLRETYPQFYTNSNNESNTSMFGGNFPLNGTNQQQQRVDPHKSLMVTSLYNTYSQNSSLNNFNNYPGTGIDNCNENITISSESQTLNSNDSPFSSNTTTPNKSLFDNFNMKSSDDGIQRLNSTPLSDYILPTDTNMYSQPSHANSTFKSQLSPMVSNELKFNSNMTSMGNNTITPNANTFATITPSQNNFNVSNISTNFMNTTTSTSMNGNTNTNRNMYLSQNTTPNYSGNNNMNNLFGYVGWNMNSSDNNGITEGSNVNIPFNNPPASGSIMNKSFGIWDNDMKVWN